VTDADERRLTPQEAARGILEAVDRGLAAALLVVVSDAGGEREGRRILVTEDEVRGTLGGRAADGEAVALGRRAVAPDAEIEEGVHTLECGADERIRVYLEVHHPEPELVVVGAGHIAQPLCTVGDLIGFRVRVLDDRPDFATRERFPEAEHVQEVDFSDPFASVPVHPLTHLVLVTRGHKYDYECLRRVLRVDPAPAYIGMIGSRRRVRATYAQLLEEGVSRERVARVHAPVGLDVGAETPAEIAVAVMAEIVLRWRGGTGEPLREKERVLERFFPPGREDGPEDSGSGTSRAREDDESREDG